MKSNTADIWNLLDQIQFLKITSRTKDRNGFFHNAIATGRVAVTRMATGAITFNETGLWISTDCRMVDFRNIYRWSLSDKGDTIRLKHLRYGADKPVHLVDFISTEADILQSFQPHRCGDDRYSASLSAVQGRILLRWKIRGPTKHDALACLYFTKRPPRIDG